MGKINREINSNFEISSFSVNPNERGTSGRLKEKSGRGSETEHTVLYY